jgi:hypothetical protein
MAISPAFSTSQVLGDSSEIVITDESTGSDVAVVSRRIYLTDNKGLYYDEDNLTGTTTAVYEEWADFPGTTTKTLDVLAQDRTFNVRVDWVNSGGTVLYTLTKIQSFRLYAKTYYLNSIKAQSSNNNLKNNANFYINLIKLLVSIKEAEDSVDLLQDISSSQSALNRAKKIVDNPSYLF